MGHVGQKVALVLARHLQLPVLRFQLVEQAHVLHGNHCLGGEGLQQRDLRVGDIRQPQIAAELNKIRKRAPEVVTLYRDRLLERVRSLLTELDVKLDRSDLIKEVSVFAERSDVSEEVVRLASHLDQFNDFLNEPESPGRKMEFLTQEMFREANTIGSKASDVEISRHVVEIKGTLEKIRELVQNIE